jgi:RpiB/LacA/LacB family sugar-phosphate isomerase
MKLVIGSDHAGFQLKVNIGDLLRSLGHEVLDVGAFNENPSDYPDFAEAVGRAVVDKKAERGVLICGSGVGASVAANKHVPRHLFGASRRGARRHQRAGAGVSRSWSNAGARFGESFPRREIHQ